ncbi:HAD-IA family hydrolase [Terriglobus roseus]|uniref:Sugar-phosphatase n=1 Tax=Terriglobus roseus TaxID=392734 RepID=A0A1G7MHR0_9BACT|nr:HAD-IA family hydrolase [Terriglobus roseus]SDF61194.1 sugar-phosphatase [Terriglobus roseus]
MSKIQVQAQGLLFDMDGVLISSIASATRCWKRWAKLYEVPNADNFVLPHGRPARDIVIMLRPDIDPDEGLRVIEDMEIEDVGDIEVLPGVRELLASLPPDRWTVVTSCTRRLLEARLRAAGLPEPPKLVSADDISKGKPDPEPYIRGAEALGLKPEDCIVVEDAVSGVQSGIAAGCRVLAVLSSTPRAELKAATWIARSLAVVKVTSDANGLQVDIPLARKN